MNNIRRATYEESKSIKSFDEFVGDRRIDNWRGELFVWIENEGVVGYISYSSNLFYNRPYISLVCVKENHRRRGIGRRLMQRVLDLYEGLDVWVSTEELNDAAIGLFTTLGFKRMGTISGLNRDDANEVYFVHRPLLASTAP
jgi:ribosomal protein S18 acetylase RimI-like enzyme